MTGISLRGEIIFSLFGKKLQWKFRVDHTYDEEVGYNLPPFLEQDRSIVLLGAYRGVADLHIVHFHPSLDQVKQMNISSEQREALI